MKQIAQLNLIKAPNFRELQYGNIVSHIGKIGRILKGIKSK